MKSVKNVLVTLLFMAFIIPVVAQDTDKASEHLTFKSVPIDGTLKEFLVKMNSVGFDVLKIYPEEQIAILKGDFAGYKSCLVTVHTLKQKDIVSKIQVTFPKCETWSALSSNYFNLKQLLTEKYGNPTRSIERWDSFVEPSDDDDRMFEVGSDNCKYATTFETDKGRIVVKIDHEARFRYFVTMQYIDSINSKIVRAKAIDDL